MGHQQSHHHFERQGSHRSRINGGPSARPAWQTSSLKNKIQKEPVYHGHLGELHLSLAYQPAINRLSVDIHRARGLRSRDILGDSDPYVKIWLLYDGRRVEKKKTVIVENTLNPYFDESFLFSVSNEKIRRSGLQISIVDYDRVGRNDFLGEVIIGGQASSGPLEATHWKEMLAQNGEAVPKWHFLKDAKSG